MDYNEFTKVVDEKERGLELQAAFPALMRKVYGWMALALVITGLTSFMVASSPALVQAIYGNSIAFWVLMIAEFGIVWYVSARIDRLSIMSATVWFTIYSVLNGGRTVVCLSGIHHDEHHTGFLHHRRHIWRNGIHRNNDQA